MKNIFPKNFEEQELVNFIYKYQYLNVNDVQYFFDSKSYYKKRITNLVNSKILRRYKSNLVLGEYGVKVMRILGKDIGRLNYDKKYVDRLKYISHIAAYFHKCQFVKFTPSFLMKDKEIFTITSRRYIGELSINGIKYLVYHISKENKRSYINSVIYDIQKEIKYKNIIILVDEIEKINFEDFVFGINSLIVVRDTDIGLEQLKYMNNVNWPQIIKEKSGNAFLSECKFCDYADKQNKYISTFYLIDIEKINRINNFLINNEKKNIEVICNEECEKQLKKKIIRATYNIIDFSNYIDKEIRYYD